MKIKIDVDEEQVEKIVDLDKLSENIVSLAGTKLQGILKENSPVDKGHLYGAWSKKQSKNIVTITNSAKYARYVNEGTGVYGRGSPIKPVNAKILHWQKNGTDFFAHSVKGQKGKKFVEKSFKEFEGQVSDILAQAMSKL